MVAPTSRPEFSKIKTWSTSLRAPSTSVRVAHVLMSSARLPESRVASRAWWSLEYNTTSQRSLGIGGHRFGIALTVYGPGASMPPTQNGQPSEGKLGRC